MRSNGVLSTIHRAGLHLRVADVQARGHNRSKSHGINADALWREASKAARHLIKCRRTDGIC